MLSETHPSIIPTILELQNINRKTLKRFISLYEKGKINKELLDSMAEIVLQIEIENELNKATSKFEKRVKRYLDQFA